MTSPVADCANCNPTHPYRRHTLAGERCDVEGCGCLCFAPAGSKLERMDRCYLCERPGHVARFCPYVKGKKAVGY